MIHETVERLTHFAAPDLEIAHGYITLVKTSALKDFSPHPTIDIKKDDECFGIHIGDENIAYLQTPRKEIFSELQEIADFDIAGSEDTDRVHLIGFTNDHLARMAKKLGFTTIEVDVPEDVKNDVYDLSKKNYKGPIMLCYMNGSDFLGHFGTVEDAD